MPIALETKSSPKLEGSAPAAAHDEFEPARAQGFVDAPSMDELLAPDSKAGLELGHCGPSVRELQTRLSALEARVKYLEAEHRGPTPDGRFGPETEQAVRDFQKYVGIARSGIAEASTVRALYQQLAATGGFGGVSPEMLASAPSIREYFNTPQGALRAGSLGAFEPIMAQQLLAAQMINGGAAYAGRGMYPPEYGACAGAYRGLYPGALNPSFMGFGQPYAAPQVYAALNAYRDGNLNMAAQYWGLSYGLKPNLWGPQFLKDWGTAAGERVSRSVETLRAGTSAARIGGSSLHYADDVIETVRGADGVYRAVAREAGEIVRYSPATGSLVRAGEGLAEGSLALRTAATAAREAGLLSRCVKGIPLVGTVVAVGADAYAIKAGADADRLRGDGRNYERNKAIGGAAGGWAGAVGGAAAGAAIGSVVPVVGTAIGGVIGGIVGGLGGSSIGNWIGGLFG